MYILDCFLQVLLSLVGIAGDVIIDRGHCFELETNLPFLVQSDEVGAKFPFRFRSDKGEAH